MATAEMVSITIDVTEEDIGDGVQSHCLMCPIAIAGRRAVPAATGGVSVTDRYIYFEIPSDPDGYSCHLPPIATRFVHSFDYGDPVKPFSFDVEIPAHFATPATEDAPL